MNTALSSTLFTPATNFSMLAMNPGMLTNIRPVNSAMPMSPVIFQQGISSQAIQGPRRHPIFDPANEVRGMEVEAPVKSDGRGRFNPVAAGAAILLGSTVSGCRHELAAFLGEHEALLFFGALGLVATFHLVMFLTHKE